MERARSDVPDPPAASVTPKLFVVGCPRSGTTWVRDILAEHPMTLTGRETHMYQDVFAPLVNAGRPRGWGRMLLIDDEHRHRGTGGHLQAWLDRASLLDLIVRAMADEQSTEEQAAENLISEIYDHILATWGATADNLFVDKTPWHLRYARRILRRFPDAKVIEVLRDGRDVCVSMEKLDRAWVPADRETQIERWVEAAKLGIELAADDEIAGRVHRVRYEDLRADGDYEITRLLAFAGIEHSPISVAEINAAADFSTHARVGDGEHRRKGIVGDWVNEFSPADLALFKEKVGDLFGEVGYEY